MLITVEVGTEKGVLEALNEIPEAQEVYLVYGVYDIIVKIKADTIKVLRDTISFKIRRLSEICSTVTMIVV